MTSLARGDHSAAIALLRAAASLGPSPLDDASTRAVLAQMPLPIAAMPATTVHERSDDGRVVAFITPPSAYPADADFISLCEQAPLEWANLENGTRGSVAIPSLAAPDRLAPLLALDADALERRQMVRAIHDRSGCMPSVEMCGSEPEPPVQLDITGGDAAATLLPARQLCGRVEGLSPRGAFAVVALPDVQAAPMGTGSCALPSRLATTTGHPQLVCVGTRYQVISLPDGRVALDAAPLTEAIRVATNERYAYVRSRDAVRVVPLQPGLAEATLAADCRGPSAFAADGETFVALCGTRMDVVTLGEVTSTRSLPLDTRGLGALHTRPIVAVAADDAADRIALLFYPAASPGSAHHRWALLDARGRVTFRVDEVDATPRAEATPVAPVFGPAGAVPVVHSDSAGPGCGGMDREHHGQTLTLDADLGAVFAEDVVVLHGRLGRDVPAEFWSLRSGSSRRGDQARMSLVQQGRVMGAGEWLRTEPRTPDYQLGLVFVHGSFDAHGRLLREAHFDHPVGPSRWDTPEEQHGRPPADLATFLSSTGTRTNLRVCPDTLRVVAVLPMPAPDTVWADAATCAVPEPTSPREDSVCRGGQQ